MALPPPQASLSCFRERTSGRIGERMESDSDYLLRILTRAYKSDFCMG